MGKIGDLWVKLGLKKDEYSKGMKEAGGEAEGFGAKLKNLAGVATAVWAAIGAAVVKFAKDAITMTQKWGDAWNTTMEGIKGAYSSFVRQISSGEGWTNLFANMREAYRVSKEVAAALDEKRPSPTRKRRRTSTLPSRRKSCATPARATRNGSRRRRTS